MPEPEVSKNDNGSKGKVTNFDLEFSFKWDDSLPKVPNCPVCNTHKLIANSDDLKYRCPNCSSLFEIL